MKSPIDNIVIYNGYPLSIIVAVGFHGLLLAFLLYLQTARAPEALELVQPSVIKALFIDENPQVVNEKNVQRQRQERTEQQRVAREQEQRKVQQEQEVAQLQEAEKAREQERERAALVERQQLEQRQQAEKLRQEQEKRSTEERERQREVAEAERVKQQQQQQLEQDRQREEETSQAAQAEAARTELELVQSATALIHEEVRKQWSRPPSARNGMRVIIQIRMLPTGELIETKITQTSGDAAFDRAAEVAVYKASPSFRQLAVLPITIFNANFRSLSLIFQPEDLLN